jgi:hypothetical protein
MIPRNHHHGLLALIFQSSYRGLLALISQNSHRDLQVYSCNYGSTGISRRFSAATIVKISNLIGTD